MEKKMVMKQMVTSEENRNVADRNISLSIEDKINEILGNLNGTVQGIYLDLNQLRIIAFHNDDGFTDNDKSAFIGKNKSGTRNNTASINGMGIKLVIDRMIPKDKYSTMYSLGKHSQQKCCVGNFTHSDWTDMDGSDLDFANNLIKQCVGSSYSTGSLLVIPLNNETLSSFTKNEDKCRSCALKYMNIISNVSDVSFFWNGTLQSIKRLCPDEESITINYTLGYDTVKSISDLDAKHSLTMVMRIDNPEVIPMIEDRYNCHLPVFITLPHEVKKINAAGTMKHGFTKEESGSIRLSVLSKDKVNDCDWKGLHIRQLDGCHVVLNNRVISNYGITVGLGGKTEFGNFVADEKKESSTYAGKPRHEHHIPWDTLLYKLPQNKSKIEPTSKGKTLLRLMKLICQKKKSQVHKDDKVEAVEVPADNVDEVVAEDVDDSGDEEAVEEVVAEDVDNSDDEAVVEGVVAEDVDDSGDEEAVEGVGVDDSSDDSAGDETKKKKRNRNPFGIFTERRGLELQPYCPVLGTYNRTTWHGIKMHDTDHRDNNAKNNSQENCNPISFLAHKIKTGIPDKYEELLTDESLRKNLVLWNLKHTVQGALKQGFIDTGLTMEDLINLSE